MEAAKKFYEFLFELRNCARIGQKRFQFPSRTDISKDDMPDFMKDIELKPMDIDWASWRKRKKNGCSIGMKTSKEKAGNND